MAKSYLIRLDDACEYRDLEAWSRIEAILDKYCIKPLVGIIPHCEDKELKRYSYDAFFWPLTEEWINKGWAIALHGYNHVYITTEGGINPVNNRSEFAGLDKKLQSDKIRKGIEILTYHGIKPIAFFAPSHTFDNNTLSAIKEYSDIRIISDCVASQPFFEEGFYFLPQQTGKPRKLPFRFITICLHPNIMSNSDFLEFENFLQTKSNSCVDLNNFKLTYRKRSMYDNFSQKIYFLLRKMRKISKV